MITGDFNGDQVDDVAIGMPRASSLVGKIVVNRWNMINMFNITGRQIGEYFGYSLATSDVDGDGLDDLIIGAPMFSDDRSYEGQYDVGRVYILLQKATSGPERWITEHIRDGYNSKSRFGTALTSLGDINRDGFGDFAVGAPYDGPEGRGIVYIFHGSVNGPLQKPSQIIKAEDIVESINYPRTFGFSLAGGVDMDGNTYPDLAVGAYGSGQVFIFKSRPVAAVNAVTSFVNPNKLIDLNVKECQTVRDNKNVACTGITTCWSYTGEYLPGNLEFDVSWVLDAMKTKNPRMFFLLDEGRNIRNQSISLAYGKTFCHNETVYVIDNIQDKLTPLAVETHYNLRSVYGYSSSRRKRQNLEPVIDQNREIVPKDMINIQKNCGKDNICIPDLRLVIETVDKYVLGSRQPLTIDVIISNMNEDAFEAAFYLIMPKDLDFKKIQQSGDKSDVPISCTAPSGENNHTLKCDIGNPFQAKNVVKFKVIMLPSQKVGMAPSYEFFMEANSTNLEREGSHFDNIIRKSIGIWVETDLSIEGVSLPDSQNYNVSNYKSIAEAKKEDDLGPHVVHLYNIRNNGPSVIEETVVLIHYPYETVAGDVLMYLTNQPETSVNIECEYHFNANKHNLELDQALVRKSYLEQVGAVVRNTDNSKRVQENTVGGVGSSVVSLVDKPKTLSDEELRRLKADEELYSTGDASFVHSQRANSGSSSSSPSVIVSSRNSSVYYDANGTPHMVESSTQYSKNFDNLPAHYTAQQQRVGNYQQAGANRQASNSYGASQQQGYKQQNLQQPRPVQSLGPHSARGHIEMAPENEQIHHQNEEKNIAMRNNHQNVYRAQSGPTQEQLRPIGFNNLGGVTSNNYGAQINKPGSGFRVGILDLGQMQNGNLDHEIHQQNGGGLGETNSYGFQQSFSPQESIVPRYHQSVSTFGGNRPYSAIENGNNYYEENNTPKQGGQQRRIRREEETTVQAQLEADSLQVDVACKAAKCETLRCVARNLGKDDDVWVAIRARMVAHTMAKLASDMPLNISTMAISYVTRLPYIGQPKDEIKRSHEIFYKAVPEVAPVPDVVPLWVVVLAACAGALILLLLILLLYKCGFFKRNRPTDNSMERQPLRNGYHGDEHL